MARRQAIRRRRLQRLRVSRCSSWNRGGGRGLQRVWCVECVGWQAGQRRLGGFCRQRILWRGRGVAGLRCGSNRYAASGLDIQWERKRRLIVQSRAGERSGVGLVRLTGDEVR